MPFLTANNYNLCQNTPKKTKKVRFFSINKKSDLVHSQNCTHIYLHSWQMPNRFNVPAVWGDPSNTLTTNEMGRKQIAQRCCRCLRPIHCKWKMALKGDAECNYTLFTCPVLMLRVVLISSWTRFTDVELWFCCASTIITDNWYLPVWYRATGESKQHFWNKSQN